MSAAEIIANRAPRYGKFADRARIVQGLKQVMELSPNWIILPADQRQALEMMAEKISRILNGNHNDIDSWRDASGYPQLVVDRLEEQQATEFSEDHVP